MKRLNPYKDQLKKIQSEYIRQKYADHEGYVKCVTCQTVRHWRQMDAGHFIAQAQGNAVRWLEDNCHPQCRECNGTKRGNLKKYEQFMIKKYGHNRVDELRALSRQTSKMTDADYQELIESYREKLVML